MKYYCDGMDLKDVSEPTNKEIAQQMRKNAVIVNGVVQVSQELWNMLADIIEAQSEWISVDERMPELIPCNAGTAYSEAVIVWTDNRKAMIAVWDGIDFLCAFDYWKAWGEKITHWMPLPEPPKGD